MSNHYMNVLVDNEELPINEAAELIEMPLTQLYSILNKNQSFGYKGVVITRIKPPIMKKGTTIKRVEDGKVWNTIKDAALDAGCDKTLFSKAIREKQTFKYNNQTYIALNYKPKHYRKGIKRSSKAILDSKVPLIRKPVTVKEPLVTPTPKVIEVTVEQKAIAALKDLAIDRIKNALYDKASVTLQALELLTKENAE